jgi:hypothetical protein
VTRDEQIDLLTNGEVEVEARVTGSSNQALFVRVSLDGVEAGACYKAEAGERPLWDFPDGLWRREAAAFALDEALGTELVPVTVGRDDLPFGPGSLQWWIDDATEDHYFTLRERPALQVWFHDLAVFDVIANNADRKSGHVLFDGDRCWAIDNGLCFHEDEKLRTVIWEFAGVPVPDALRPSLEAFVAGDVGDLPLWLTPSEVARTQARAATLLDQEFLPIPDEEREWPPYPWPLI